MTHKPDWLVDWYENGDSRNNVSDYQSKGKNVIDLICNILKEKCKLQIVGDIHHYMHHATVPQPNRNNNEPIKHLEMVAVEHLHIPPMRFVILENIVEFLM